MIVIGKQTKMNIVINILVAIVISFAIGRFTRYWVYNGVHSIIGTILLVCMIGLSIIYGSFGVWGNIAIGCVITFGIASLINALGRAYDKYAMNTHLTISIIVLCIMFIV